MVNSQWEEKAIKLNDLRTYQAGDNEHVRLCCCESARNPQLKNKSSQFWKGIFRQRTP